MVFDMKYDQTSNPYYKPWDHDIATTTQSPSISSGETVPPIPQGSATHIQTYTPGNTITIGRDTLTSWENEIRDLKQIIKNLSEALVKK